MRLTFTLGDRLGQGRIFRLLQIAKSEVDDWIANHGALAHKRLDEEIGLAYDAAGRQPGSGNYMDAMPLRKTIWRARYRFEFWRLRQAVELFELCGVARGHFEEMWANVYVQGLPVGYLWAARNVVGA